MDILCRERDATDAVYATKLFEQEPGVYLGKIYPILDIIFRGFFKTILRILKRVKNLDIL